MQVVLGCSSPDGLECVLRRVSWSEGVLATSLGLHIHSSFLRNGTGLISEPEGGTEATCVFSSRVRQERSREFSCPLPVTRGLVLVLERAREVCLSRNTTKIQTSLKKGHSSPWTASSPLNPPYWHPFPWEAEPFPSPGVQILGTSGGKPSGSVKSEQHHPYLPHSHYSLRRHFWLPLMLAHSP